MKPPQRSGSTHTVTRLSISLMLCVGACLCGAASAQAQLGGLAADGTPNITFIPGLRLQPRYTYDNSDANNDFFIARTRIKGSGEAYHTAKYAMELKVDNVGRFAREVSAQIENAWLEFGLRKDVNLRVGLYDGVFSRNALTSDSKLLLMDRSLVKDALTALGLADNSIGLLGHGRPWSGRYEYSFGVFDNLQFDGAPNSTAKQADGTMQMGRLGAHLLDPATPNGYGDYKGSYIGKGRRLSMALNAAYLSRARDNGNVFAVSAWGGDVFFNSGPVTLEAEYDRFRQDSDTATDINGEGWYVQTGYLVKNPVELAARYQVRDADGGPFADRQRWTTAGVNVYLRDHNLKVQTEYTFKREQANGVQNDLLQMQLQIDY